MLIEEALGFGEVNVPASGALWFPWYRLGAAAGQPHNEARIGGEAGILTGNITWWLVLTYILFGLTFGVEVVVGLLLLRVANGWA